MEKAKKQREIKLLAQTGGLKRKLESSSIKRQKPGVKDTEFKARQTWLRLKLCHSPGGSFHFLTCKRKKIIFTSQFTWIRICMDINQLEMSIKTMGTLHILSSQGPWSLKIAFKGVQIMKLNYQPLKVVDWLTILTCAGPRILKFLFIKLFPRQEACGGNLTTRGRQLCTEIPRSTDLQKPAHTVKQLSFN